MSTIKNTTSKMSTTKSTTVTKRNKPLTFFHLPREIRDDIYAFCMNSDKSNELLYDFIPGPVKYTPIYTYITPPSPVRCTNPPTLSIQLVSKQIHTETRELFFSRATLAFWTNDSAWSWLSALPSSSYVTELVALISSRRMSVSVGIRVWGTFFG